MNCPYHTQAPEKVRTLPEAAPAKTHRHLLRDILYCAVIVILLGALVFGLMAPRPVQNVPGQQQQQQPAARLRPTAVLAENTGLVGAETPGAENIIASINGHQLTNQMFIYYYWDSFYSLFDYYGDYISSLLDPAKPFDEQQAIEGQTWHEYISAMAVNNWYQTEVLYEAAKAAGHELDSSENAYLLGAVDALLAYAEQGGFPDRESYLRHMFDPCSDVDSYRTYNEHSMTAGSYASRVFQQFYDKNFDPEALVLHNVNVRHILIAPEIAENPESLAAAEARAESLLEEWKKNPTEENFSSLAAEHTADGGSSQTGGLYQDVYPGQMVPSFNDWCFDTARKPGDTGIVESQFGYHIMYFVGESESVYKDENADLAQVEYEAWLQEQFGEVKPEADLTKVVFTEKAE